MVCKRSGTDDRRDEGEEDKVPKEGGDSHGASSGGLGIWLLDSKKTSMKKSKNRVKKERDYLGGHLSHAMVANEANSTSAIAGKSAGSNHGKSGTVNDGTLNKRINNVVLEDNFSFMIILHVERTQDSEDNVYFAGIPSSKTFWL
jgi:hypothetical protein